MLDRANSLLVDECFDRAIYTDPVFVDVERCGCRHRTQPEDQRFDVVDPPVDAVLGAVDHLETARFEGGTCIGEGFFHSAGKSPFQWNAAKRSAALSGPTFA